MASKEAINTLLTSTFPKVRAVLDAPIQMQKGSTCCASAAAPSASRILRPCSPPPPPHGPADRGPVDSFAYEPGRLILSAQGWSPEQIEALRSQLRSEAWTLDASDGRLIISHTRRS